MFAFCFAHTHTYARVRCAVFGMMLSAGVVGEIVVVSLFLSLSKGSAEPSVNPSFVDPLWVEPL